MEKRQLRFTLPRLCVYLDYAGLSEESWKESFLLLVGRGQPRQILEQLNSDGSV